MAHLIIAWIILPFLLGFVIYLVPSLDRYLSCFTILISLLYGCGIWLLVGQPQSIALLDSFGVTLLVDRFSSYFILTNAIVTLSVIFYCWQSGKTAFFYLQLLILHGSINSAFLCADFISLYVALEMVGVAAFLLIAYPRTGRSIWVALRYLLISNTVMLFYLLGVALVYQANHSFSFSSLQNSPPEAVALISLALLSKGGVFLSGLWLPFTHAESDTPVSALLSGVVVKTGVFSLLRCALLVTEVNDICRIFGVASAIFGVTYGIFAQDIKRLLAFSTISQLGWMLVAPEAGGFFALAHGVSKSALFMTAGNLPSRKLPELAKQGIDPSLWLVLAVGGLSMSGLPFLPGFAAKASILKQLLPWQIMIMNGAAVGTAMVYARLIFLPRSEKQELKAGVWNALVFLLTALLVINYFNYGEYTWVNSAKSIALIMVGWLGYGLVGRKLSVSITLPKMLEEIDHLMGAMSLILIVLFWMVLR